MGKKLTITDLLAQKEQLKQKKQRTMTLHIDSLDAEIVIQEPSRALALEVIEMAQSTERSDMADIHLVYHIVIEPNLKDTELQKQFNCAEPTDIVGMIFRAGEIGAISGHALEMSGYGKGVRKIDDELKN